MHLMFLPIQEPLHRTNSLIYMCEQCHIFSFMLKFISTFFPFCTFFIQRLDYSAYNFGAKGPFALSISINRE